MDWKTPSPKRKLSSPYVLNNNDSLVFENVAKKSYEYGLDSKKIEIVKGANDSAWFVREIERSLPTNVDSVTIHPVTLEIIDSAFFKDFNLASKLTRWGIDLHMGTLFGLTNQLLLIVIIFSLIYLIVSGYQLSYAKYKRIDYHLLDLFIELDVFHKSLVILVFVLISWWLPWFLPIVFVVGVLDYLKIKYLYR